MRDDEGRFIKGASGNPAGRPRVILTVRDLARAYTNEAIEVLASIMRDPGAPAAARIGAANEILNRGYGRPVDHRVMEIMAKGDRPVTVKDLTTAEIVDLLLQGAPELIDATRPAGES